MKMRTILNFFRYVLAIYMLFFIPLSQTTMAGLFSSTKSSPIIIHQSVYYQWGDHYDSDGVPVCYFLEKEEAPPHRYIEKKTSAELCQRYIPSIYLWGDEFEDVGGTITDDLVCYQLTPNKLILKKVMDQEYCQAFHGQVHKWGKTGTCHRYDVSLETLGMSYNREEVLEDGKVEKILVFDQDLVGGWRIKRNEKPVLVETQVDLKFCRREDPGTITWDKDRKICLRKSNTSDKIFEYLDKTLCLEKIVENVCPIVPYMELPYVHDLVDDLLSNVELEVPAAKIKKIAQPVVDIISAKAKKHYDRLNQKPQNMDEIDEQNEVFDEKVLKALKKEHANLDEITTQVLEERNQKRLRHKMLLKAKKEFMKVFDLNLLKHQKIDQEKIFQSIVDDVSSIKDSKEKQERIKTLINHYVGKFAETFWGGTVGEKKKEKMILLLNHYLELSSSVGGEQIEQ